MGFGSKRSHRKSLARDGFVIRFFEKLEARELMTAEGSTFAIDRTIDTSALLGTVSATATWGDGTSSPLTVSNQTSTGSLRARIDYSLDARGFFNSADRRQLLQLAADSLLSKFADTLSAIQPSGTNTWRARILNPATGATQEFTNPTIATNEIMIYAGGRDLPGNQLGEGGAGGISSSGTQDWINTVRSRGQAGVLSSPQTDFGTWGGYIAFDDQTNWHFGLDTSGLDPNESDFISVATHELSHALGVGISQSWNRYVQGQTFVGLHSMAAYDLGGAVPLSPDLAHWREGTADGGQETLMDPSITTGTRKLLTGLDLAGLADVGWQVIVPSVRVTGSHVYGDDGSYLVSIQLAGSQLGTTATSFSETVTNVPPTLNDRTTMTISSGSALSIVDLGVVTDPGFDVPSATPPKIERFRYRIDWGDGSTVEQGDVTIDQMGSAGIVTRGSFDGNHVYANPGNYNVTYSVTDDDGGSASKSFVVQVTAPPTLTISLDKAIVSENGGPNAAILTVRRSGFDTTQPSIVTLTSFDTSEIRLPSSVTILAGGSEAIVAVEAIDDTLLDGTQSVNLLASIGNVSSNTLAIQVLDHEVLQLALGVQRISENAGAQATSLTITRSNTDTGTPLLVGLTNSDSSEASIPVNATIPASSNSVTVGVDAVDDNLFDGLQSVQFQAIAAGYVQAAITLEVEDAERLDLSVRSSNLTEDASNRRTVGRVNLSGAAPAGGLQVQISSSPASQVIVPALVTVPAGTTGIDFDVIARDDYIVEGPHSVRLTASSSGLPASLVDIAIADNDQPVYQNPVRAVDVDGNGFVTPRDALLIINLLNLRGIGELPPGDLTVPPFVDSSGDGILDPFDILIVLNYLNLNGIG